MSRVILEHEGVTLGTFHGGAARGPCFQITTSEGYVQLTLEQAAQVADAIWTELEESEGSAS